MEIFFFLRVVIVCFVWKEKESIIRFLGGKEFIFWIFFYGFSIIYDYDDDENNYIIIVIMSNIY